MTISVSPPYPIFGDRRGESLENGTIYIGAVNQNPLLQSNWLATYSDSALTIPVAQPVRTDGGYPVNNSGSPIQVYVAAADYSIVILDRNGELVFSSPSNKTKLGLIDLSTDVTGLLTYTNIKYDITTAEVAAGVVPPNLWALPGDVRRYGADPTGVADSATAWSNAIKCNALVFDGHAAGGAYIFNSPVVINTFPCRIMGTASNPNLTTGTIITLQTVAGASAAAFQTAANKPNILFEDITVKHQTSLTGQVGWRFGSDSRYCRLTRCVAMGTAGVASTTTGIQFDGTGTYSAFNVIDQCYVSGHRYGIDLQGINTVVDIRDTTLLGYTTSLASYGVKCSNNSTYAISGGHIEGFNSANSRGIYSEGSYNRQMFIRYEVNTVNWEWVRTAPNPRIYGMAFGEAFVSGGNPIYPINDVDACMVLTGPGFGDLDTMALSAYRGFKERNRTVSNGTYTTPPYLAGNFTANGGGVWTVDNPGDITTNRYAFLGSRNMHWVVTLVTTAITVASPTTLNLTLPLGSTGGATAQNGVCEVTIAGVAEFARWTLGAGSTLLAISRLAGGSFGTVAIGLNLNAVFEIA